MSRNLNDLDSAFGVKIGALLQACKDTGYEMRPFFTLRTPLQQAGLWRQSRSTFQITERIDQLRESGADFLAGVIESAGPQNGPQVTNAIPGLSWHQWGEAVDCFWLVEGRAEWSTRRKIDSVNGYANYAQLAADDNLTPGGHWTSFKDWPHIQLRAESSPARLFSMAEIDQQMRSRFGG